MRNYIKFCLFRQKLTNQSPVVEFISVLRNLKLSSVFEEESAKVDEDEAVVTKIDVNNNYESDKTKIDDNLSNFKRGFGDGESETVIRG